jgi:FkbM family methyltransferase
MALRDVLHAPGAWLLRRRVARERAGAHQALVAFYGTFVRSGDLVFDIGANVGDRSAAFLELGAKVVAVEPQARCVATLREAFAGRPSLTVEPVGLADAPGTRTMFVASESTVCSMAGDWVEAVQETGRFGATTWDDRVDVDVTTFDALIARHGVPAFTKIDVEGFESVVLSGLSQPIPMASFEFVHETRHLAEACVRRLESLGVTQFNLSVAESLELDAAAWISGDDALASIAALGAGGWGDVYARTPA